MSRDRSRVPNDWDDDEYDYEYAPRRRRPQPHYRPAPRRQRRRRVWPWLLAGCAGGIVILVLAAVIVVFLAFRTATNGSSIPSIPGITSQSNYTRQSQQILQVSSLTQLQIHNQIGNVTITVDPNATNTTITTVKKVKAASLDDASKEFNNIAIQVQAPNTTNAPASAPLTINATVPDSGSIFGNHNDSVDINIALAASAITSETSSPTASSATPTATATAQPSAFTINVNNSIGNIMVSSVKGILLLKDDIGNISVDHSTLFDTTHILTGTGNVTFNGGVDSTPLTSDPKPRYKLQSETGTVDVTLPGSTNVTLEANTNYGKISSDFPINVTTADKAANFYGPLNPGANSTSGSPLAVLTLDVGTGDVTIHRV